MTISINSELLPEYDLTAAEATFLLFTAQDIPMPTPVKSLIDKGFIDVRYCEGQPCGYFITQKGTNTLESLLLKSDKVVGDSKIVLRVDKLVPKLQECFPTGKKPGTPFYWRGNKTDIKKKLLSFIKKYGNDYTDDEIIEATKSYVEGFNGQYKFMRLLQYFIWKEEVKDGTKVTISELANHLENAESEESKEDWTTKLV